MRRATATEQHPERWLERVEESGTGLITDDLLTAEETGDEFLLMGLRLTEGVDLSHYEALTGRRLSSVRRTDLISHGLVEEIRGGRLRTTASGALVLDAIVADLAA